MGLELLGLEPQADQTLFDQSNAANEEFWRGFEYMKSVGLGMTVGGRVFGRRQSQYGGFYEVPAWD